MGGEHSGIGDAPRHVFLEGAFWNPAVIQGKVATAGLRQRRRLPLRARRRFRRHARRAVERATQLIIEICGGHAGPLTTCSGALPRARSGARAAARASRASSASRFAARPSPRSSPASVSRTTREGDDFRRHAAVVSLRPRDRGRFRRGGRAPPRLRHDSRGACCARAGDAAGARDAFVPRWRCERRLVARDWQEVITFSFVSSASEAAAVPRPDAPAPISGAEPDRQPPRRDAHDARWAACSTCCAPISPAGRNESACSKPGRCFVARRRSATTSRCASAAWPTDRRCPEQWGRRPARRRFLRRQGRPRGAGSRRCTVSTEARHASGAASGPRGARPRRRCSVRLAGRAASPAGPSDFELPKAPVVFELDSADAAPAHRAAGRATRVPLAGRSAATWQWSSTKASRRRHCSTRSTPRSPAHVVTVGLFDVYRGPGCRPGQKKPCDSGAYAGY